MWYFPLLLRHHRAQIVSIHHKFVVRSFRSAPYPYLPCTASLLDRSSVAQLLEAGLTRREWRERRVAEHAALAADVVIDIAVIDGDRDCRRRCLRHCHVQGCTALHTVGLRPKPPTLCLRDLVQVLHHLLRAWVSALVCTRSSTWQRSSSS